MATSALRELNSPELRDEEGSVADQVFVDDETTDGASSEATGGAWELSKENVLPLRAGRRVKCLNDAVTRDSLTQDTTLREERHSFEAELRCCSRVGKTASDSKDDDDVKVVASADADAHLFQLLDVWHRYVNWTEQNYPSGKELNEILQRSLQAFPEASGEMGRVAECPPYVDLWLKLANQREDPGDIFQFMYSKKIGRSSVLFYEQWAWHLEDAGNTKKASAVLAKGVVNVEAAHSSAAKVVNDVPPPSPSSSPANAVVRLEKLKADLEYRVARGLRSGFDDLRLENEENEPSRKTLGDLRGKGKHMTAPNVRVGPQATISGVRRGISGNENVSSNHAAPRSSCSSNAVSSRRTTASAASNTSSTSSSSSSAFRIFSDDADHGDFVSDHKFSANPVDASTKSKENVQKATSWNKVKARQKASSIPTTPLTPAFDIHVDEIFDSAKESGGHEVDDDGVFKTPAKTPAKTIVMTHSRPLSTKKVGKEPNKPLDFLEKKDDGKTEEKLMFCKDKVYQGLEEFSFEEIRFESWKQRK